MNELMNRRDLLELAGMGVAVLVSGTTVWAGRTRQKEKMNDSSILFSYPTPIGADRRIVDIEGVTT
jgi:hypothetical protein